jgi:Cof subfamily protein (haloacid dehalogenase superfamily)
VKLIASDLDGTLLLPGGEGASERTLKALRAVVDAGLVLVLVTGRPPRRVRELAPRLNVSGLAICCNGALIYDLDADAIVGHSPCDSEIVEHLVIRLREAAPGVRFAFEMGAEYGCEPSYLELAPPGSREGSLIGDALHFSRSTVTKLIVRHPEITLDALMQLTQELGGASIAATHSGAPFVEVSAAGVHKAWALAELAAARGIERADVVAFGDMPNDVAMLEWAGLGVAVANGHPAALAAADEVTLSNREDGVAIVLERLLDERAALRRGGVG